VSKTCSASCNAETASTEAAGHVTQAFDAHVCHNLASFQVAHAAAGICTSAKAPQYRIENSHHTHAAAGTGDETIHVAWGHRDSSPSKVNGKAVFHSVGSKPTVPLGFPRTVTVPFVTARLRVTTDPRRLVAIFSRRCLCHASADVTCPAA
jgi:hypothetical protein